MERRDHERLCATSQALIYIAMDRRMKRYFKRTDADSIYGLGTFLVEYDGDTPARQVEVYGDKWFSSREEYHPELGSGLTDRPLSEMLAQAVLGPDFEITAEEFEAAWLMAAQHTS